MERYRRLVAAADSGCVIPIGDCVDDHVPNGLGRIFEPGEVGWVDDCADEDVKQLLDDAIESVRLDESLGQNGRLAGQQPGHWLEELAPGETPQSYVDWKMALQSFAASIRIRLPTYSHPNRRFPPLVGVIPGRTYFPGTSSERQSLLIVIDTSGSMQRSELKELARHLNVLDGLVRMTVVECDYEIQRVYPYVGTLRHVRGRGRTDLRPVFSDEFLKHHQVG